MSTNYLEERGHNLRGGRPQAPLREESMHELKEALKGLSCLGDCKTWHKVSKLRPVHPLRLPCSLQRL